MAFDGSKRMGALQAAALNRGWQTRVIARWGLYFLLGFTMACARVLGTGGPFGMALVAAAGSGGAGIAALAGAALGYLVNGGLDWSLRYIAASVLVFTVSYLFQELPVSRLSLFMPTAAGIVIVDVVPVGFHLGNLFIGDVQTLRLLGTGQGNPQSAPGAEFVILRKQELHFRACIPCGKRAYIAVRCHLASSCEKVSGRESAAAGCIY